MEKKILPAGDAALVVEFGREISDELNEQVHLLAGAMKRLSIHGVREVLPTFRVRISLCKRMQARTYLPILHSCLGFVI